MYDYIGFAETHYIAWALLLPVAVLAGYFIWREVKSAWRDHKEKTSKIDDMATALIRIEAKVDDIVRKEADMCDITRCPGLAELREDLLRERTEQKVKLEDMKSLMVSVTEQIREALYELVGILTGIVYGRDPAHTGETRRDPPKRRGT